MTNYLIMFRTTFQIPPSTTPMEHESKLLMLGSCFSENIGNLLIKHKFQVCLNPFGILFNPLSIENGLRKLAENAKFNKNDLLLFEENWLSLHHHSRFTFVDQEECLTTINTAIERGHEFLKTASTIVLTLGTAYYYFHKEEQIPVANCHKIPQKAFEKRFLNLEDSLQSLENSIALIQKINPQAQIVLTLSPVRHWKDGLYQNQKSKATLYLAIQEMVEKHQVNYFPAYELLLDDLRDYRFYKSDMLHPNETAVQYIWEKFQTTYFSPQTQELSEEIQKIQKSIHHRPRFPNSSQHLKFQLNLLNKMELLEKNHPYLEFKAEKQLLKSKLKNRNRQDF